MTARRLLLGLSLGLLLGTSACRLFGSGEEERMSAEELRDRLNEFVQRLINDVDSTADAIAATTTDRTIRQRTLRWKIAMVEVGQEALLTEPPTAAFLDLWTLTVQLREYLEEGGGKGSFGEQGQSLAVQLSHNAETAMEAIAARLLTDEQLVNTRAEVHDFVDEYPLTVVRGRVTNRASTEAQASSSSTFSDVLSLPLAPFRAFGGIDNAATAVREFASVADRFTTIVQSLPEQTRWQMELLLYDIEDRETVQSVLSDLELATASVARFTDTAERLSASAEQLPEELRATLLSTLEAVTAAQPELQRTLAEARATAEALGGAAQAMAGAVNEAAAVTQGLEATAQRFTEAGVAWAATGQAFGLSGNEEAAKEPTEEPTKEAALQPPGQPVDEQLPAEGEPQGGFDVVAYGTSAEKLTEAAIEIRALVEQIDALLADDRLERVEASTAIALQATTDEARSLADHVAWRALQVLLAALAGLLVYRLISSRLIPPAG